MRLVPQMPGWSTIGPLVQELLAGRPAGDRRLLALEPGRAAYFAGPIDPARSFKQQEPDWLSLAPQAWPLAAGTVDLVAGCNLAETNLAGAFVAEAGRALKVGGLLVVCDRIVPGSDRRGRQARQHQAAGAYLNALARLRDGRHSGYLTQNQWMALLIDHSFRLVNQEMTPVTLTLGSWLAGVDLAPADVVRLEVMLRQAPAEVAEFLRIDRTDRELQFHWPELLVVAARHA